MAKKERRIKEPGEGHQCRRVGKEVKTTEAEVEAKI
jgi:hypothetical protein